MYHRLFQIDVLARVHRVERHLAVPMVGSRNHHGVDIGLVQQLTIIGIAFDIVLFGLRALAFFVDIDNSQQLAAVFVLLAIGRERLRIGSSPSATADDADVDSVIRPDNTVAHLADRFGGECVRGRAQCDAGRADSFKKISAVQ